MRFAESTGAKTPMQSVHSMPPPSYLIETRMMYRFWCDVLIYSGASLVSQPCIPAVQLSSLLLFTLYHFLLQGESAGGTVTLLLLVRICICFSNVTLRRPETLLHTS